MEWFIAFVYAVLGSVFIAGLVNAAKKDEEDERKAGRDE